MTRILVTGASGFIGSGVVRRLVAEGHTVVAFDNNSRGSRANLADLIDRLTFIEGDIRNKDALADAAQGCDALFHLAFVNGTRFFYEKPQLVLDVGVKGALNTLEVALEKNIGTYVLASSSEIYQQPTHIPTTESERAIIPDVQNPRYSYAGGKLISELLAINYLRNSTVRCVIFRPHNVFGPAMGFEHVIPELVRKLYIASDGFRTERCVLPIQGTGEETRAFCYIDDAVDQIYAVYGQGQHNEVYHIGMDTERSIGNLISDIAQTLGITVEIQPGELQPGGTSRRCPSIDKVRTLGYSGSDHYRDGLANTVQWYKNHFLANPPA